MPALPSATTPLSSSSFDFDNQDSREAQDEDNFELPTFKLPGTPISESEGGANESHDVPLVKSSTTASKTQKGQGAASRRRSSRRSDQQSESKGDEETSGRKLGESVGAQRRGEEKADGGVKAGKKAGECISVC